MFSFFTLVPTRIKLMCPDGAPTIDDLVAMAEASLSDGCVFHQRCVDLDANAQWPSPLTCAFPTAEQSAALAQIIISHGCTRAVSIGCGEGAAERALIQCGLRVIGVDVHALSDTSAYENMRSFLPNGIVRVRPDQLYSIPEDEESSTALLFFWGRHVPWRSYLRQYTKVPLVCCIGELTMDGTTDERDVATQPSADALDGDAQWTCSFRGPVRAVHGGAILSVFARAARKICLVCDLPIDLLEGLLSQYVDEVTLVRLRRVCKRWQLMVDERSTRLAELRFGSDTSEPPPLVFDKVDHASQLITPSVLPPWPNWAHRLVRDESGELRASAASGCCEPYILAALCWSRITMNQLRLLSSVPNSQLLFAVSCGLAPLVCLVDDMQRSSTLTSLYWEVARCVLGVLPRGCLWHGERIDSTFWQEHLRPKGEGPRVEQPGDALERLFNALELPSVLKLNDSLGTLHCMPQLCIGRLPAGTADGPQVLVGFVAAAM